MVRWRAFGFLSLAMMGAFSAPAEQLLTLISYTNLWRYNQDAVQPPAAWREPGFNDGGWLQGMGVFAVPAEEPLGGVALLGTVLSLYAPTGTAQVATYYFRTTFEFPYMPDGHFAFVASNLIDDGALFYVNGVDVGRVGMQTGTVAYATAANRSAEASSGIDRLIIPRTPFVRGLNTVAVEVHQFLGSSDAVFGMSLTARVLDPVEIVREPEDVSLEEGQTLTLSVGAIGSDAAYQWYRNTTRLTTNTAPELIWRNIAMTNAGTFYVVVSNSVNVVTSRLVTVTVLRDVTPPVLLSAEHYINTAGQLDTGRVVLTFTEPLLRIVPGSSSSATNVSNYTIREFGTTNLVTVNNAIPGGGFPQVLLTVGPLNPASMYLVTVTNVMDLRSNLMTRLSSAYIGFYTSNALVAFDSIWAWDESGNDLGTAWRQPDYDDRFWPRGRGVFAYEFDTIDLCGASKNTSLSVGPTTYYFRLPFVVPRTSGKAVVSFVAETIDDGAIIYLNSQELRRVNMPAGPVTAATRASVARDGICARPIIRVNTTNVVAGTNLFAVEVHQAAADFDVVFGMQVDVFIQQPYPLPVPLNIAREPSGEVVLSWTGREGSLKAATNLNGQWFTVATNSPTKFSSDASALFFRLDPPSRFD